MGLSSRKCILGLIRLAGFKDTETQMGEFRQGGAERRYVGLTTGQPALREGFEVRVVADGDDRRPIKYRADPYRPDLGQAGAPHERGPGLAFHGHPPPIGRELLGRAEVRALPERQPRTAHWGAHGGHAGEQRQVGFLAGMAITRVVDSLREPGAFLLEERDRVVNGRVNAHGCRRGQRLFPTLRVAAPGLGDRRAAGPQGRHCPDGRGWRLPGGRLEAGTTAGADVTVPPVGCGAPGEAPGESLGVGGVAEGPRDGRRDQRGGGALGRDAGRRHHGVPRSGGGPVPNRPGQP